MKWSKPLHGTVRSKIFRPTQVTMNRPRPFKWLPTRLRKLSKKLKPASGRSLPQTAEESQVLQRFGFWNDQSH